MQQPPTFLPPSCSPSNTSITTDKDMASDAEVDALLANAGYSVKSSDLAQVAQRLVLLGSALSVAQEAGLSHLSYETVHYDPSDLAGRIESIIGELPPHLLDQLPRHGEPGDDNNGDLSMVSSSLDSSPLEARGSHNAGESDTYTQQHSAGSITSVSHLVTDAIGHKGPHGVAMCSEYGMALMDEEGYQYKCVEDQTSSSNQMDSLFTSIRAAAAGDQLHLPALFNGIYISQGSFSPSSCLSGSLQPQHCESFSPQVHVQPVVRPQELKNVGGRTSSQSSNEVVPTFKQPTQRLSSPHHHQQQELNNRLTSGATSGVSITQQKQHHHQEAQILNAHIHLSKVNNSLYAQQSTDVEGAQESGIRLVHLLMACAEAVHNNELAAAVEMVGEIKRLASPQNGTMGKVANKFVDALTARICGLSTKDWITHHQSDAGLSDLLYCNFYETCPYLKFAHFTANQAILEAFDGHKFVHVIDFNLMHGLQWPALIQALALRPGGPPHLRLTGIGPPQPDNKDVLQDIGMRLAEIAASVNVTFSFQGVVATKLDDVKPRMLQARPGEAVAVNSVFQLHPLLYSDNSSAEAPINQVLQSIKSLSPKIVTVVEQEANHNSPNFLDRFIQALHYYSTMFDSLEACGLPPDCEPELYSEMCQALHFTEMYLGKEIINIVACEGAARTERHESLSQWRMRMFKAGFRPLHLGSNAFNQASMLLRIFSAEGYTVEENNGCLTLGWHSRPLIASSAWQCG
uniref:GRAS-family protein 1 n=1 Tax=Lygodium japonicum TaxID=13824 RepID=A0A0B6VQI2_LYGJA|nr:GRAS-family protein 1 [Lygodium japonicum]